MKKIFLPVLSLVLCALAQANSFVQLKEKFSDTVLVISIIDSAFVEYEIIQGTLSDSTEIFVLTKKDSVHQIDTSLKIETGKKYFLSLEIVRDSLPATKIRTSELRSCASVNGEVFILGGTITLNPADSADFDIDLANAKVVWEEEKLSPVAKLGWLRPAFYTSPDLAGLHVRK